jgi:hypothetical protein
MRRQEDTLPLPRVLETVMLQSTRLKIARPTARGLPRTLSAGYPLVGGTRKCHFAGTSFKPRKLLENAQTPTSRVHAVLGGGAAVRLVSFLSSSIILIHAENYMLLTCL